MHRLVGASSTRLGVERPRHLATATASLGEPDGLVRGQVDAGGEAPGAVVHDPDGEPEVLAVGDASGRASRRRRLRADPLDPDVGVLAAEVARPGQRGVGQRGQRQGEEGLVDGVGVWHVACLPAGSVHGTT